MFIIALTLFLMTCDSSTDPKETKGTLQGTVWYGSSGIYPAFIFSGDSLWATTDENGHYLISALEEGNYELLCSALNYRDTTVQVAVSGGKTTTFDIDLVPDTSTGLIYGEFQDIILFNENVQTNPELAYWNPMMIYQATTGATMIDKFLQYDVPDRQIWLGDSLLRKSDEWGQFVLRLQIGTYPLSGSCAGYYSISRVVKVLPDTIVYVNFFMNRTDQPKLVAF
jgi:hypothetical protein